MLAHLTPSPPSTFPFALVFYVTCCIYLLEMANPTTLLQFYLTHLPHCYPLFSFATICTHFLCLFIVCHAFSSGIIKNNHYKVLIHSISQHTKSELNNYVNILHSSMPFSEFNRLNKIQENLRFSYPTLPAITFDRSLMWRFLSIIFKILLWNFWNYWP